MKRNTTAFGQLAIGTIPRVVGTISSRGSLSGISAAEQPLCDVVEVRLDETESDFANRDWAQSCQAIEGAGYPIIFTVRLGSEGGKWKKPDAERIEIFKTAAEIVSAIDVELKSQIVKEVAEIAKTSGKALVVSYHDFEKTPSYAELKGVLARAASIGSVVKISTMVKSDSDILTLRKLLDENQEAPLCVIGMGPIGTKTRTGFPMLGSCLTYGYLDMPSAPGQLPATALVEHLRMSFPNYNEDIIIRRQILEYA